MPSTLRFKNSVRMALAMALLLPPAIGIIVMSFVGIYPFPQVLHIFRYYSGLYVLAWALPASFMVERFLTRAVDIFDRPEGDPLTALDQRLIKRLPWLFMLLIVPYFVGGVISADLSLAHFLGYHFDTTSHLYSLLGALPAALITILLIFFYLTDRIGQFYAPRGLKINLVPMSVKIAILGLFTPALIDTLLLLYFYDRTGYFTGETLLLWAFLLFFAAYGVFLARRSFHRSLKPLQGPVQHPDFLVTPAGGQGFAPNSLDELGLLTSGWARLVQAFNRQRQQLLASEERFKALFDDAPLPYMALDRQECLVEVNQEWLDILGYQREEVVSRPFVDFMSDSQRRYFGNSTTPFSQRKEFLVSELELATRDGSTILVDLRGKLSNLEENDAPFIHCIFRDVTEQKRMEQALAQARAEWDNAMDFFEDAIYIIDLDDRVVRANRAFYQLTGLSPEQAIGQDINAILHPKGEPVPCPVCKARQERRDAFITMEPHHPDNPTGKAIEVMLKIIRNQNSEPLGVLMGIHDLSRQRVVEDQLRRSKEEWERTFNSLSDIITFQDNEHRILRVNKAACDFFNVPPDQLIGRHCYELFRGRQTPCEDCPVSASLKELINHTGVVSYELLGGRTFQVTSSPVLDEQGGLQYVIQTARDITRQKRLEEELFQAHKMEAIGTLAGGIAHDFNNILAAIVGYTEMAGLSLPPESQARKELDAVLRSSMRARDLVKQILTFSRKADFKLEPINPAPVIKEAIKMLRASIPTTIEIRQEIDADCGSVIADPTQIHQVLVNLCTNAYHAMEESGGTLTVRLAARQLSKSELPSEPPMTAGPFLELTVTDTGVGMDEETVTRIFEPYFTTKTQGKGTGMGLAVTHGIVSSLGGFFQVRSQPGQGTIFRVYLPCAPTRGLDIGQNEHEGLEHGSGHILLVDDEPDILETTRAILEGLGYRVTCRDSGVAAIALFRSQPETFDLVITDMTMPRMTGAELARQILTCRGDIPVILTTGFSSRIGEEEARAMGISTFLMKPVRSSELARSIHHLLHPMAS